MAFVYTERALYVGARMHADDPTSIRAVLARRDDAGDSERLSVALDSYQNRRASYSFAVTAAGGRLDWFTARDEDDFRNRDYSYNPVWAADAVIDSTGWTAELEIPFSQIRFNKSDDYVWGVNINRYIPTRNEDVFWIAIPRNESGWASWFGDLEGVQGIRTRRPVEVMPYVASAATFTSSELIESADPFRDRSAVDGRVGADLKMGVGPSLTLDATFNPDFGQVEADPAEVNLSAFPTFFQERRPFFVEGREILERRLSGGGGNGRGGDALFYSRRIGAPPGGEADGDFVDRPLNTTILAAGKLTGRTPSGFSLGALASVTSEEYAATYDTVSAEFDEIRVEPATGWVALSGQQEFGAAASTVGLSATAVRRFFSGDSALATQMNREAYAATLDWNLRLEGGAYELRGLIGGSYIGGSAQAIRQVQEFSSHYFQRPDADYVTYDTTRTSLSGYAFALDFERTSAEHWLWEIGAGATSPGYEINDAGRLRRADRIEAKAAVRYRENTPGLFHRYFLAAKATGIWNFGGERQPSKLSLSADFTLRSFSGFEVGGGFHPRAQSDNLTRGGPSMEAGSAWEVGGKLFSDRRARTNVRLSGGYGRDELGGWSWLLDGTLELKPGGAVQLRLGPTYWRELKSRQYVGTFEGGSAATFGSRYVFAFLDRATLSMQVRLNYAFNPDLSVEVYAEPFVDTGRFLDYGELGAAGGRDLRTYGTDGTTIGETAGAAPHTLTVRDGDQEFSFEREDFRALSFRSNLVLRWEWRPGSTLFAVWQLDRQSFVSETGPERSGPGDWADAVRAPGRSFFALKLSYWLPL